ncbi:hypothetical protein FVE85_2258 [Porphyridium purpureum]|uniref:Uncharacterized protein n=1 Tax=Porphyridium purpureum TaxID=35688 RepID=A0A5J4YZV3_PORPP|nr:hypothetical protein FVE85_2258 [Porphyridium purpureum]|eukprot:POR0238..scf209_3
MRSAQVQAGSSTRRSASFRLPMPAADEQPVSWIARAPQQHVAALRRGAQSVGVMVDMVQTNRQARAALLVGLGLVLMVWTLVVHEDTAQPLKSTPDRTAQRPATHQASAAAFGRLTSADPLQSALEKFMKQKTQFVRGGTPAAGTSAGGVNSVSLLVSCPAGRAADVPADWNNSAPRLEAMDAFRKCADSWQAVEGLLEVVFVHWGSNQFRSVLLEREGPVPVIHVHASTNEYFSSTRAYNLASRFSSADALLLVDCATVLAPDFLKKHRLGPGQYYASSWASAHTPEQERLRTTLLVAKQDFDSVFGYDERMTLSGYQEADISRRLKKERNLKYQQLNLALMRHLEAASERPPRPSPPSRGQTSGAMANDSARRQRHGIWQSLLLPESWGVPADEVPFKVGIQVNAVSSERSDKWNDVAVSRCCWFISGTEQDLFYDVRSESVLDIELHVRGDHLGAGFVEELSSSELRAERVALGIERILHDAMRVPWDVLVELSFTELLDLLSFMVDHGSESHSRVVFAIIECEDVVQALHRLVLIVSYCSSRQMACLVSFLHSTLTLSDLLDVHATTAAFDRSMNREEATHFLPLPHWKCRDIDACTRWDKAYVGMHELLAYEDPTSSEVSLLSGENLDGSDTDGKSESVGRYRSILFSFESAAGNSSSTILDDYRHLVVRLVDPQSARANLVDSEPRHLPEQQLLSSGGIKAIPSVRIPHRLATSILHERLIPDRAVQDVAQRALRKPCRAIYLQGPDDELDVRQTAAQDLNTGFHTFVFGSDRSAVEALRVLAGLIEREEDDDASGIDDALGIEQEGLSGSRDERAQLVERRRVERRMQSTRGNAAALSSSSSPCHEPRCSQATAGELYAALMCEQWSSTRSSASRSAQRLWTLYQPQRELGYFHFEEE